MTRRTRWSPTPRRRPSSPPLNRLTSRSSAWAERPVGHRRPRLAPRAEGLRGVSNRRYARPVCTSNQSAAIVSLVRNGQRPWREYAAGLEDGRSPLELLEQEHGLLAEEVLASARQDMAQWQQRGIQLL